MAKILRGLNGREHPVELQAGYSPHRRPDEDVPNWGVRSDTPAAEESRAVLARRSHGHVLAPARLVPEGSAQP